MSVLALQALQDLQSTSFSRKLEVLGRLKTIEDLSGQKRLGLQPAFK